MSRRGDNIRKRKDGRWEARYKCGHNSDGKTVYRSVYADSYKEAKSKRDLAAKSIYGEQPKKAEDKTFCEVFGQWLEYKKPNIKPSTRSRYLYLAQTHILPEFGNLQIKNIGRQQLNDFVIKKINCGKKQGGPLSAAYVRSIMIVISSVMNYAVQNGYCDSLPNGSLKPTAEPNKISVLSISEQAALAKMLFAREGAAETGILLSLLMGLRLGEVCALKWSDIDISNEILNVRSTLSRVRRPISGDRMAYDWIIDKPKTRSSQRSIPIPARLMQRLLALKERSSSEYVISDKTDFVNPRTFEYRYRKIIEQSGIEYINFHGLRHTFATRCIEAGMDAKTLSEILGHSGVSITLSIYVHSSMELKRRQMKKTEEICM